MSVTLVWAYPDNDKNHYIFITEEEEVSPERARRTGLMIRNPGTLLLDEEKGTPIAVEFHQITNDEGVFREC